MNLDFIKAGLLGVLEGLTEFIPVSSTGHLILAGDFLNFTHPGAATFKISIQLGAILAVIVIYWDFFKLFLKPSHWVSMDMKRIMVAISPALVMGFLAHGLIKTHLFLPIYVVFALFFGGIVMVIVDRLKIEPDTHDVSHISYRQALMIGLFQCASLWPGMSRSGSTIVGGIFAKLSYDTAARFSFIISVPVMIAAVSYDLLTSASTLTRYDFQLIGIGFATSFLVGMLAIVSVLKLLNRFKLRPFGIYRICLSLVMIYFLFGG